MARELLGKEVTEKLNSEIKAEAAALQARNITPTLAILRIGAREDDLSYERGAMKRCETLGVACKSFVMKEDVTREEVLETIHKVNGDSDIHGVLIFRPFPKHLDEQEILSHLSPEKDVDGITAASMASVFTGEGRGFPPCTAEACMKVLEHYQIPIQGKRAVVIGRSLVIGKPVSMMLLRKNATVTICHTRTVDIEKIAREADILVAAAGKAGVVDGSFVSPGQTVLDVGIHVNEAGKLCGDVDYEQAAPIVECITPVPGGVGSVTTSVLVGHVVQAAKNQTK